MVHHTDYSRKFRVLPKAHTQPCTIAAIRLVPVPVEVLVPVPLPAAADPPAAAASLVTIPAVVNASPDSVSVCPRFCPSAALFNPVAAIDVKQNNSESKGVVAHPPGQHTLLVPLTE
jgi:hypothetical protein